MQPSLQRIHPLVAAAAVSIILVSMLGVATMTGVLPHSNSRPTKATASDTAVVKPALLVASAAQGNVRPTVETPAANSATDASRRPPTAGETLAPGETLITLPAVASVASTKAPAASTPVVRESRRRASVGRRVVEPWGAAPPRQLPAQRIVPVYRDQRLPRTTVPSPQETGGAADIEQPVPMYSHGAASERAFLGTQAYRRAVRCGVKMKARAAVHANRFVVMIRDGTARPHASARRSATLWAMALTEQFRRLLTCFPVAWRWPDPRSAMLAMVRRRANARYGYKCAFDATDMMCFQAT